MGLISGIVMGTLVGIALMAGWSRMRRPRSTKRVAKLKHLFRARAHARVNLTSELAPSPLPQTSSSDDDDDDDDVGLVFCTSASLPRPLPCAARRRWCPTPTSRARRRRPCSRPFRVEGTPERPRMSIFRSNKHLYVQVIDDMKMHTLASASTMQKPVSEGLDFSSGPTIEVAKKVGEAIAKACLEKGVTKVAFDKGGYQYHGRIEAVANAAREHGLEF